MALSKTNLIVNQIPKNVTDSQFRDLFGEVGEIKLSTVIKDRNTKESLCYGFVEYVREEDALAALEHFNNYPIEDKFLKVQFARRSNNTRRGGTRIFVSKLPPQTTESNLQELFGEFGEISEIQLPVKSDGSAKGYSFITYQEEMDAKASIEALNQYTDDFYTQPLSVKISVSDFSIQAEKKKAQKINMNNGNVMGGQASFMSTVGVSTHVQPFFNFPNIRSLREDMIDPTMIPPPPPKRRKEIPGESGSLLAYKPEKLRLPEVPPNSDGVTLFFYNIGKDTDETQMKHVLLNQGVGAMLYIAIVRDPTTMLSKNFAFVKFRNQEDAQQTIATLHRTDLFGCGPCEIKFKTYSTNNSSSAGKKSAGDRERVSHSSSSHAVAED